MTRSSRTMSSERRSYTCANPRRIKFKRSVPVARRAPSRLRRDPQRRRTHSVYAGDAKGAGGGFEKRARRARPISGAADAECARCGVWLRWADAFQRIRDVTRGTAARCAVA